MMTFKFAPAVVAGNTVIVKSSEKAPLTALYLAKPVKEAGFPPGMINFVSGFGPPTGEALASHPKIRKISFTGSVQAGKAIQKAAALSNLKKVTLKLGGKSPLIILDDANVVKLAQAASASIILNSGQACIASSRIYVHTKVANEFRVALVKALKENGANPSDNNDPLSPTTKRGPQGDQAQL